MRSSADRFRVAASIALAVVVLFAAVIWWETPNLRVEVNREQAVIHMELLGEYPTDLRSIEIASDAGSALVWRIVAVGDLFQMHSIPLRLGTNAGNIKPDWGTSVETAPGSSSTFSLAADRSYQVKICPASFVGVCRSTRFVLTAQ